jgi:hypothetical protein
MINDPRSRESFQNSTRRLEEAFFLEQDKILIERLRAMKKMAESKDALRAVSTIENDAVLTRLVELDIKPEIVAALAVVPLVEVAWADGKIERGEREAVQEHARSQGIAEGSIEDALLERWLEHRPEPRLLEAWQSYIQGLCEQLSPTERGLLKDELLRSTRSTAAASGGWLGLGRISAREQAVLDRLVASFGV